MQSNSERFARVPKSQSPERRASIRFALSLELGYSVSGRRVAVKTGVGRTIDLSSSGLSFTTDRILLPGQKLDVFIDWPVLLDGAIRLQLVMSGMVVRTDGTVTAMQIKRHEFRTRRVEIKVLPPKAPPNSLEL